MFSGLFGNQPRGHRDGNGKLFIPEEHYRRVSSQGMTGYCCTNCEFVCWQDECPHEPCVKCGINHTGKLLDRTSRDTQKGVGGMFDFGDDAQHGRNLSFFGLDEDAF